MENKKKWSFGKLIPILLAVAMVVGGVAVGATILAPDVAQAQDGSPVGLTAIESGQGGPGRVGPHGKFGPGIDYDAFLAEALGISVEELQAAYETANQAALAEAVAQGYIEEEQVERMEACKSVNAYIDHDAVIADLLGISVEELQSAREDGKQMPELLEEAGLTNEDVRDAMQAAFEAAVEQALASGEITQAQADEILSSDFGCGRGFGPGGHGGPGFPGGRRSPGGFGPFPGK